MLPPVGQSESPVRDTDERETEFDEAAGWDGFQPEVRTAAWLSFVPDAAALAKEYGEAVVQSGWHRLEAKRLTQIRQLQVPTQCLLVAATGCCPHFIMLTFHHCCSQLHCSLLTPHCHYLLPTTHYLLLCAHYRRLAPAPHRLNSNLTECLQRACDAAMCAQWGRQSIERMQIALATLESTTHKRPSKINKQLLQRLAPDSTAPKSGYHAAAQRVADAWAAVSSDGHSSGTRVEAAAHVLICFLDERAAFSVLRRIFGSIMPASLEWERSRALSKVSVLALQSVGRPKCSFLADRQDSR